jgi:hypothetical protein
MGIAQDTGVIAVLFDHSDSIFDDALGKRRFTWRDLFLAGNRAGEFPAVVRATHAPCAQSYYQ